MNRSGILKQWSSKIEFWIFVFFLIRLIGITNPPLEISHNWRQVTGLMVARNFVEVDANVLYPRIDDFNGGSDIIAMEFPSMNYLHYLFSELFGYTHWYGRLINLVVSSLGLFFFYKCAKTAGISERTAFYATIILSASIWFSFSRKMMPDTYCISLMFIALYCGLKFLHNHKYPLLFLYVVFSSLALLSKIPAGIYLVVLLPFVLSRKFELKNKITISVVTAVPLILAYWWYFIWNPYLASEYRNWYNIGKPMLKGIKELSDNLGKTLDNFYFDAFSGFIMFGVFAAGLFLMIYKKNTPLFIGFTLLFLVFLIYIFKSGFFFYHHNYYIIPFVPVMALLAGYAIASINKRWIMFSILLLGISESIANQQHDFFIKDSEKYKLTIEPILNEFSSKNDLILVNGNGNPQLIYLAHRKGFNCDNAQLNDSLYITNVKNSGCRLAVVNKHSEPDTGFLQSSFNSVFDNDDFRIFALN